jgi:maleate cis-trans isomerase
MIKNWRGTVGDIRPSYRAEGLEEFIRLPPEGISVIPLCVGIKSGGEQEFHQVLDVYKSKAAELAALGVDLIHISGAPPMMVHGFRGEEKIVGELQEKHGIPITTAGRSQINAFKALGVKNLCRRYVFSRFAESDIRWLFYRRRV